MAKLILKFVFCFAMLAMCCAGMGCIDSGNWMYAAPMILGSLFAFGCAVANGWVNDLVDFIESCEEKMLG